MPADARSLSNGRKQYAINCAVVGDTGKGDGPIVPKGFPGIPLVGPASPAPGRTDGYIWGMIRNGRGLMPAYNRIELERWDVVNYVRGLQGRYAVQTGPVGLPGETGDKLPGYSQTGPTRPQHYVRAGSQAGPSMPGAADAGARPVADVVGAPRQRRDRAARGVTCRRRPRPAHCHPRPRSAR